MDENKPLHGGEHRYWEKMEEATVLMAVLLLVFWYSRGN
jgi:hypothetical protein